MAVETRYVGPPHRFPGRMRSPLALLLIAALVGSFLWARGEPHLIAWELVRDHERCFGRARLPARLWSNDPWEVRDWLEARGTPVQPLPRRVGELELIGVRYCPLVDRIAAHIYYASRASRVSVFVIAGPARIHDGWRGEIAGLRVRMLRSAGRTLAIVGAVDTDVEAMAGAFRSSVA
jgi:hypothetical protein